MVKVFIGSTKEDLIPFREAVRDAALELGCHPEMMEYWAAMDATAVKACMDKVDECGIYVGIFAHRYGYCPVGSDISITEMEFDRATANGIQRLCFLVDPKAAWQPDFIEGNPGKRKLKAFKKRIDSGLIRAQFSTPADLKDKVKSALHYAVQDLTPSKPAAICSNVPPPDRFVGRGDEMAALNRALTGSHAVAITAVRGIGGIGKSTLAKAFARQDTRFPFKLWAELGQTASEDLLPRTLRSWTGADFPPDWSAAQMIAETRRLLTACAHDCGEPVLLLLDDVWMETVPVARQLRDAAPLGATVLITTRSEDAAAALDANSTALDALPPDQGAALIIDLIGDASRTSARRLRSPERRAGRASAGAGAGSAPTAAQLQPCRRPPRDRAAHARRGERRRLQRPAPRRGRRQSRQRERHPAPDVGAPERGTPSAVPRVGRAAARPALPRYPCDVSSAASKRSKTKTILKCWRISPPRG